MTRTDLRSELLADTILGTDTAFDLIDEIAAIPGVKWSHAPCIGLRGSIGTAAAPMAERIRAADPETEEPFESPMDGRSLRWKEEEQALCPIAIREWHANNVDDMMMLECVHTEPWDAVFNAWWERFPDAAKEPVASPLWPVPVPMIPWMLIIHAADEAPLEGATSVEPHKTPYTMNPVPEWGGTYRGDSHEAGLARKRAAGDFRPRGPGRWPAVTPPRSSGGAGSSWPPVSTYRHRAHLPSSTARLSNPQTEHFPDVPRVRSTSYRRAASEPLSTPNAPPVGSMAAPSPLGSSGTSSVIGSLFPSPTHVRTDAANDPEHS